VFADVDYWVEFYGAFGAEGLRQFLFDLFGCIVDEYASLWFAF